MSFSGNCEAESTEASKIWICFYSCYKSALASSFFLFRLVFFFGLIWTYSEAWRLIEWKNRYFLHLSILLLLFLFWSAGISWIAAGIKAVNGFSVSSLSVLNLFSLNYFDFGWFLLLFLKEFCLTAQFNCFHLFLCQFLLLLCLLLSDLQFL